MILHDHLLGRRIAEAGCQEIAVLDGRSFQFVGPQQVPTASGMTSGDASSPAAAPAGTSTTVPDPGVIKSPARFAILTVQPDGGDATYAVVTVEPDTTVTVTPEISLDVPYRDFTSTGRTAVAADDR